MARALADPTADNVTELARAAEALPPSNRLRRDAPGIRAYAAAIRAAEVYDADPTLANLVACRRAASALPSGSMLAHISHMAEYPSE